MTLDLAASDDGYVVVPLLDDLALARCREHVAHLGIPQETPRWVSALHLPRHDAIAVDAWLRAELAERVLAHLGSGYEPFLAAYFAKGARHGERMHFHQDWTYTDERHHRSVLAWIPLIDVDGTNGAMEVVPGSHRWTSGLRASGIDEAPPTDAHLAAFAERATTLTMRAGDAFIYDAAIVHATPPNTSDQLRPVAGLAFKPVGAPALHFRHRGEGHVEGHRIPRGGFYMDAPMGSLQDPEPVQPWAPLVAPGDFISGLESSAPAPPADARAGRSRRRFARLRRST